MKNYSKQIILILSLCCLLLLPACSPGDDLPSGWETKTVGAMSISYPDNTVGLLDGDHLVIAFDEAGKNGVDCRKFLNKSGRYGELFKTVTPQEFAGKMQEVNPAVKEIRKAKFINLDGEKVAFLEMLMENTEEKRYFMAQTYMFTYDGYDYNITSSLDPTLLEDYAPLRDEIIKTVRIGK